MSEISKETEIIIAYADTCFAHAQEITKDVAQRIKSAGMELSDEGNDHLTVLSMALVWHLHLHYNIPWDVFDGTGGLADAIKQNLIFAYYMGMLKEPA